MLGALPGIYMWYINMTRNLDQRVVLLRLHNLTSQLVMFRELDLDQQEHCKVEQGKIQSPAPVREPAPEPRLTRESGQNLCRN